MRLKHAAFTFIFATAITLLSTQALAHRVWIKPNTTVVSGEQAWVTFDAAIANGIFNPDHFAYPLERLTALGPDGKAVDIGNSATLKYRSVFDLHLQQEGTYRVYNSSHSLMAFWQDKEGNRQMWPGRGKTGTKDALLKSVPMDADNLNIVDMSRRVETFVTLGAPSDVANSNNDKGLTLSFQGHPNDLYTQEPNRLSFLFNNERAEGVKVTLVRGGQQYRDTDETQTFTTDASGNVTITFEHPGMYWLEAQYSDSKAKAPVNERRGSYVVVLEVLPL